jgi:hypothetical protein
MVAFASGEGAPVVMVECDEVLQLWRVKWVRKLQENVRIGGSGRCSPKAVVWVWGAVGRGVALERGTGEEWCVSGVV